MISLQSISMKKVFISFLEFHVLPSFLEFFCVNVLQLLHLAYLFHFYTFPPYTSSFPLPPFPSGFGLSLFHFPALSPLYYFPILLYFALISTVFFYFVKLFGNVFFQQISSLVRQFLFVSVPTPSIVSRFHLLLVTALSLIIPFLTSASHTLLPLLTYTYILQRPLASPSPPSHFY